MARGDVRVTRPTYAVSVEKDSVRGRGKGTPRVRVPHEHLHSGPESTNAFVWARCMGRKKIDMHDSRTQPSNRSRPGVTGGAEGELPLPSPVPFFPGYPAPRVPLVGR